VITSGGIRPAHYPYTLGDIRVDIPYFIADVLAAVDVDESIC